MKKETYLRSLLAFLLLMVGVNSLWAEDIVLTPSLSDTQLRLGNEPDYKAAEIETHKQSSSDQYAYDFSGLMQFDISAIQAQVKLGYKVKGVTLRLTNSTNQTKNITVKGISYTWDGSSKIKWDDISSTLSTAASGATLATVPMVKGEDALCDLGKNKGTSETGKSGTWNIAQWQATSTSTDALVNYVAEAVAGTSSVVQLFLYVDDNSYTSNQKFFSVDVSSDTYKNESDTYTWTSGTGWTKTAEKGSTRFAEIKKYLGYENDADLIAQLVPVLTVTLEADKVVTTTSLADGYVRGDGSNANNKYTSPIQLVRKSGGALMYGYMTFPLAEQAGYELQSATLRLTAKRVKGDRKINIYPLDGNTTEDATYNSLSSVIANPGEAIISEYSVVGGNMDVTSDAVGTYNTIGKWQNNIDLTSHVKNYGDKAFGLLLERVSDATGDEIHFFAKEATTFTNNKDATSSAFTSALTADDLKPQLTLVYKADDTDYTITKSEGNGTFTVSAASAKVGTFITISDVKPFDGYELTSLTATYGSGTALSLTDNGDGTYTFLMPADNVTVTTTFAVVPIASKTITVKDQPNANGNTVAYADGSKTVAYTAANNSVWYLGDVDLSKVYSIEVKGAAFVNGTVSGADTKAQLKLAYLASADALSKVSASTIGDKNSTIRDNSRVLAVVEAETTPATVASGKNATNYPGADFVIKPSGVTQKGTYDGTVTMGTSSGISKTDGVYQLFLYGTASSRRLAVDEVIIHYLVENVGDPIPDGAYTDKTLKTAYYDGAGYETLAEAMTAVGDAATATVSVSGTVAEDYSIAAGKSITIAKDEAASDATLSGEATVHGTLTLSGVGMTGNLTLASTASLVATDMVAPASPVSVTVSGTPATDHVYITGGTTANFALTNLGYEFVADGSNLKIQAVKTTGKEVVVKDRVSVNGGTRKYADDSKTVASTNSNSSIWYLGDVDMSKVYSITVKGAAFVNGTVNDEDTKAQLKLGFLPVGTIRSVSTEALSTNSGTIRSAAQLMAQLTARTTPAGTMAEGTDASNYAGADFEITTSGITQTGTYDGTVEIDATNTKGLQKTDAVYQLFLYGTAEKRRLAVDEVMINFKGTEIPEGAYTDKTYEEPMTNVGQDTSGEPTAADGYVKAVLGSSADTYLRKGNTDNNGDKPQMEVYTYTNTEADPAVDKDFVGLLAFDLPTRAKSSGAEIQKVQLRLVGKRLKGGRNMEIYGFGTDFKENAKYADLQTAVEAARQAGAIHTYETRGQVGLDVESDYESLKTYNKTIAGWTNYFDLTDYVKGLSDTKVRLMIASPDNSDNPKMYYTKEAKKIKNEVMEVEAADLVPQLIVVYKAGENVMTVTHPAMLHTQEDLDRVKDNIGMSPVREAFAHLQESAYAQTTYKASPVEYLKRMDEANWGPNGTYGQHADFNNYTNAMKDAHAAYQLALRYQLEGSTACADAAVKIMNDWAATNKGLYKITGAGWANDIPDPNEYLILIQGHQFANAAELLRDYSGWQAEDFTKFKSWMRSTFSDNAILFLQNHHNHVADKHYWLNWDLAALTSVLSVGILCEDKDLTDYAISYYQGTAVTSGAHTSAEEVGSYANAIPYIYNEEGTIGLGQCQESGRDQGHSLLDVSLLGAFCQMAKNMGEDGEDLFATDDYRAVKMAEYVGKYNLGNDVEFTAYHPNAEYNHTAISAEGRGGVRPSWELFYRYAQDNGKTAKYTGLWVEKLRAENAWGEGGAGDYGTASSGFDQLGYGTLMYADVDDADGQDEKINEEDYAAYTIGKRPAQGDTFVRSDNADTKNGSAAQMEIRTSTIDGTTTTFSGLLSFKLPKAAVGTIERAQLYLVTKRKQASRNVNVYGYQDFDETSATYNTETEKMTAAKSSAPIAGFKAKGQVGKDVTGTVSEDYQNLEAWTNRIDLTDYVKGLTDRNVNLLLADGGTGTNNNSVQFFTKERADDLDFASASDLQPRLIVIYSGSTAEKTFMVEEDGFDTLDDALAEVADGGTIIVTGDATLEGRLVGESTTARITIPKNVTIKGKTGTEVISRGSSDAVMKQSVLFKANSGKTVTFENLIYDDNAATVGQVFEVDNNTFVLRNMTIQNSMSSSANGVVHMKRGALTLDGLTFKDSEINNAFIHLGGGQFEMLAPITLSNSTGDHLRLGAIEIDDEKIPAMEGGYQIEVEDASAKIVNAADPEKYQLTSIGYQKVYSGTTITFVEESDGQDTGSMDVPEGAVKVEVSCLGDTYVRKGNTADNGKRPNMEVYTYTDKEESLDFVGLMGFKLPDDLLKEGAQLHKAQLRLVTKRVKGSPIIDMYAFYRDFEESATYDMMESQINTMRDQGRMHRFYARGQAGMDIVSDSLKLADDYVDISKWTNLIDMTILVENAMTDDGKIRFALMSPVNGKDAKMFFTKEADSIKNERMDIKDIYIVPQLTLIYTPGAGASTITAKNVEATPNADTFVRKGSTNDNSISTCIEAYTYHEGNTDIDFVGLLSFALNEEVQSVRRRAQAGELELFSATLRLVTKRVRGERDMNVYLLNTPFSNLSTYAELEDAIKETRENAKYATFKTAGQANKDITTDSGLTGTYKTSIVAWTNEIDLTELVKGMDTGTLRLMLSAPGNERSSKQYFSSEAESFTNENNKDFIVAAEELVPQLVISYRNPNATDIEEVFTIPATENEEIYDLRGHRVKAAGKGVYIVNGKKVLMK